MRIAFFADAASPHSRSWISWFGKRGHEIVTFAPDGPELPVGRTVYEPIAKRFWLPRPDTYLRVKSLLAKFKPDVVYAHYVMGYGWSAALQRIHPLGVSVWGSDVAVAPKESWINRRMCSYVLRSADFIHVGNEETVALVRELGGDPAACFATPWGTDLAEFSPARRDPALRADLLQGGRFLFLANRNLTPPYQHELLIRATARLVKTYPHVRVVIAGDGPLRPDLEKLTEALALANHVRFLGRQSPDAMPGLHASADAYVDCFSASSPAHGASVSIMEALACGTPVLVAQRPTQGDVFEPGADGLVFEPQTPEALSKAMTSLVEDPGRASELGSAGRRRAERVGDREKNLREIEARLERLT